PGRPVTPPFLSLAPAPAPTLSSWHPPEVTFSPFGYPNTLVPWLLEHPGKSSLFLLHQKEAKLNKKMAVASVMASCSGSLLFMPHMISIPARWPCKSKICHVKIPGSCIQRPISYFRPICASIRSNDHYGLSYGDGFDREPFWLSVVKGVAMCLKSLAVFLAEQPSQLKYIEWPGFQNTVCIPDKNNYYLKILFFFCLFHFAVEDIYPYPCSCGLAHCCFVFYRRMSLLYIGVAAQKNCLGTCMC
ncbi:unnamed protein product, partial [Musa hybrid cultivar]